MKLQKILLLAGLPIFTTSVSAALLGVTPIEPFFDYDVTGTTQFTAADGSVVIDATPFNYTSGGTLYDVVPFTTSANVSVRFSLDSTCSLSGGDDGGDDLVVSGDVVDATFTPIHSGTLLTGEIIGLGIGDTVSGVTTMDAKFAVSGGELVTAGDYMVGAEIGMTVTMPASTYAGACDAAGGDWSGGAKGRIGALEVVEPPVPPCFDVKKLKIREGRMCHSHWGSYGNSKSKISASLRVSCDDGFDPANSLISVGLDGENFEFPIGSFSQVGSGNKYRAWIAGSPNLDATLNCDKGRFSFSASKADTSQIDTSDGVDITLVLGATTHTQNVMASSTGHHYSRRGHNNVFYYHNDSPENCAVGGGSDDSDMNEIKCRHKGSGRIYSFKRSKGGYGKNLLVHDSHTGNFSMIDTSRTSGVSCGWSDANFEVVSIDHKLSSKSCTMLSEDEEDDDVESNQYD